MLRSRYVTDNVETMSPGRLVVALYDRLMLDFERAERAIDAHEIVNAHDALVHAQDIVFALLTNLNTAIWSAGPQLAAVYHYLLEELVRANVSKDASYVQACAVMVAPLRDAWREAAGIAGPALPA
jgi:flagellar protein FliS